MQTNANELVTQLQGTLEATTAIGVTVVALMVAMRIASRFMRLTIRNEQSEELHTDTLSWSDGCGNYWPGSTPGEDWTLTANKDNELKLCVREAGRRAVASEDSF